MSHLRIPRESFAPRIASENQKAASKRNWALFQARSMRGNIYHLKPYLTPELYNQLQAAILACDAHIVKEIENGKASKN